MKRKNLTKILLVVFMLLALGLFFMPTVELGASAPGKAKDPHEHIGGKTLCYNTSMNSCDS